MSATGRAGRVRPRWGQDRGATGVEYALIASLIAVVVLLGVVLLGVNLRESLTDSNDAIDDAITGAPGGVVRVDEVVTRL